MILAYYVLSVQERNKLSYSEKGMVINAIDIFQLYSGVSVMAIIIITNLVQQGYVIEATRRIVVADVTMKQCGIIIDCQKAKYCVAGRYSRIHSIRFQS